MEDNQQTLIIVITGAPGAGVSTLAHRLSKVLDIRNRVITGAIDTTLRTAFPNHPTSKSIKVYTLEPKNRLHKILAQRSRFRSKYLNAVLKRYSLRGIPTIISGHGIFSRFLNDQYVTLFITVAAPSRKIYEKRLHFPTWTRRTFHYPLPLAEKVNQILLAEARATKTPVIRQKDVEGRVKYVLKLLKKHHMNVSRRVAVA